MTILRKPLLVLLLLFCCAKGFSATFVVTSNADSGPGTLRDALTQAAANGTTLIDYINFNLPDTSVEGRTIIILSPLITSSNLQIDGSTQPGKGFGVSNAKIKITCPDNYRQTCIVIDSQTNVSIFGLLLDGQGQYGTSANEYQQGIAIGNSKNITIGAPGKGNVIKNFGLAINTADQGATQNLTISANFLAVNEDGISVNNSGSDCQLWAVIGLVFGGDTPADANVVYGNTDFLGADTTQYGGIYDVGYVKIKNNFIGINYLGQDTLLNNGKSTTSSFSVQGISSQRHIELTNNIIFGGFDLTETSYFTFKGNKIGTDITGTKIFPSQNMGVVLGYCNNGGIVGGTDAADQNVFAGLQLPPLYFPVDEEGVIDNINSDSVNVIGNYFKCNSGIQCLLLNEKYTATPVIMNRTATTVTGTGPPNSRIDLYYSVECSYCEPQVLFASVNTDASGNWSYIGSLQNHAIIAAATLNNSTSEFTKILFLSQSNLAITPSCNGKNGSITGVETSGATTYAWYNEGGTLVSDSLNLKNVGPGKYYLVISDGYCTANSPVYEIDDASNAINDSLKQIVQPSCGNANGNITGLQGTSGQTYTWKNQNGNTIASTLDLLNVAAGSYTLYATTPGVQCTTTYGPVTLKNTSGPNIDQSHAKIQSTNCGQTTGSVTNLVITGTGTLKYIWWNGQQQTVSTDSILTNQPAGTYKLEVTDDSQCGAVYSTVFTIPETNGITIDTTNVTVTPSGCIGFGSVTGLQVSGSTQYQWRDAANNLIGTNINLNGVPPGTYTFTATNSTGCIATSKPYIIKSLPPTVFPVYPYISNNTCPNSATGSITLTVDTLVAAIEWYNSQGKSEGIGNSIEGQPAGTYTVYLTDKNGCRTLYNTYAIHNIIPVTIQSGSGEVTGDQCNLKQGSITGIAVGGGIQPYAYRWTDGNGNTISTNIDLTDAGAGTYTLTVIDSSGCAPATAAYTIQNTDSNIPAPSVSNVQLCSSGSAMIVVNNASATASYNLYDSPTDTVPAEQEKGGKFRVNVTGNISFFITQVSGSCESNRTQVNVIVGLSTLNIANTFTPNGDGINDYWKINNIENYPQALVQIFTRYGEKIFESRGYAVPFDGTYKGQKLPAGVYYFIINLNSNCSLLSGSLTIIR